MTSTRSTPSLLNFQALQMYRTAKNVSPRFFFFALHTKLLTGLNTFKHGKNITYKCTHRVWDLPLGKYIPSNADYSHPCQRAPTTNWPLYCLFLRNLFFPSFCSLEDTKPSVYDREGFRKTRARGNATVHRYQRFRSQRTRPRCQCNMPDTMAIRSVVEVASNLAFVFRQTKKGM